MLCYVMLYCTVLTYQQSHSTNNMTLTFDFEDDEHNNFIQMIDNVEVHFIIQRLCRCTFHSPTSYGKCIEDN